MNIQNKKISVDELLGLLPESFTSLTNQEQELSLAIYRNLGRGMPVSQEKLSASTTLSTGEIDVILKKWPGVFYEGGSIVGYWGLAIGEMPHQIQFEDRKLYGWCAWDTLFIPQILGEAATIFSRDQESKEQIVIRLDQNGDLIEAESEIMVSMLIPDEERMMEDLVSSFCHYIHFYKKEKNGIQWIDQHEKTFLISLDQAIELSQAKNQLQYQNEFASIGK